MQRFWRQPSLNVKSIRLKNTAYLIRQNQALLYAKSAEAFASELLVQDSDSSGGADYLQETWAQPMPPFPVDDGMVSGQLKMGMKNLISMTL